MGVSPRLQRALRRIHRGVLEWNDRRGRFAYPVWLIGEGQADTDWLLRLMNPGGRMRQLYEPFHPLFQDALGFEPLNVYRRPGRVDPRLMDVASRVFRGDLFNERVDGTEMRMRYGGLIAKDVSANLIARWVVDRLPSVRLVVAIRHPIAVARERLANRERAWPFEPVDLLRDTELLEDHFSDQAELIERIAEEGDTLAGQVLIWAATHHVLFRQFADDPVDIVFHEELLEDPRGEVARIWRALGENPRRYRPERAEVALAEPPEEDAPKRAEPDAAGRPVRRSRNRPAAVAAEPEEEDAAARRARQIRRALHADWSEGLARADRDRAEEILAAFGLDRLYDAEGWPDWTEIEERAVAFRADEEEGDEEDAADDDLVFEDDDRAR